MLVPRPVDTAFREAEAAQAGRELARQAVVQGPVAATSTRFSIEVSTDPGARPFWFESTPMASLPASAAAWITPMPLLPVA